MTRNMRGTTWNGSVIRMMIESVVPPKYPETTPRDHPDDEGNAGGQEADHDGNAFAVQDLAEDLTAEIVRAHQVRTALRQSGRPEPRNG
jgi:hypothetical protein